jgi:hypothetical protein
VSPGSFHVSIANWIGMVKHPVIMDLSIHLQIWNFPVFKYTCNNCTDSGTKWKYVTAEQAMAIIGGSGTYIFNHAAKRFADVDISLVHAEPYAKEQIGVQKISEPKRYRYILELNERNEIIGGEWAKESQKNHPDFIWVSLESKTPTGERQFANPEIDAKKVMMLWKLSIDDPNPEEAISEPVWEGSWGKYTDFNVTIDGDQTGAVFLGKKTKLVIQRNGDKLRSVDLELQVNNKPLKLFTNTGSASRPLEIEFDSPPGINNLTFKWKILSKDDVYHLRYYAIP